MANLTVKQQALTPIIKWVGGKRWIVPWLKNIWSSHRDHTFVEPFAGGIAVALGLNPKTAVLNDANPHLINFYTQIKQGIEIRYRFKNQDYYYYTMRKKFNRLIRNENYIGNDAAAIFYYLIKTGFNGLCRFNNSGEFNVPFGQHEHINYKKCFDTYKEKFKNWQFISKDFSDMKLDGTEFLYVDPPYDVEFTKYHAKDFIWEDQLRLAEWLMQHKGPIVTSNQATPRILSLYQNLGFVVKKVLAPRRVACNGNRKPAPEILAFKGISNQLIQGIKSPIIP